MPLSTVACDDVRWQSDIEEARARFNLDAVWIRAVMHVESDACASLQGKPMTSAAGAMGLMQLMPSTWNQYRAMLNLGNDPYDPHDNILAGTAYLRDLLKEYGVHDGLAAYAAGPRHVEDSLDRRGSIPNSIEQYVANVLNQGRDQAIPSHVVATVIPHAHDDLFAIRHPMDTHVQRLPDDSTSALFAIVHAPAARTTDDSASAEWMRASR